MVTGVSWCGIGSVVSRSPPFHRCAWPSSLVEGGAVLLLHWESPPPKLGESPLQSQEDRKG